MSQHVKRQGAQGQIKKVHQIEADISKSERKIMKAKLALTDSGSNKLARDMAKNKQISLCVQNGTKHKYIAPLSSLAEVKKCYDRIKKLSEANQLTILRQEVKLKNTLFSEMLYDFVCFKQYNTTVKKQGSGHILIYILVCIYLSWFIFQVGISNLSFTGW